MLCASGAHISPSSSPSPKASSRVDVEIALMDVQQGRDTGASMRKVRKAIDVVEAGDGEVKIDSVDVAANSCR